MPSRDPHLQRHLPKEEGGHEGIYDALHMLHERATGCVAASCRRGFLLEEIGACTSPLLEELFAAMTSVKSELIRLHTELAEALCKELRHKLAFHRELPYRVIKISFGDICGGCSVNISGIHETRHG